MAPPHTLEGLADVPALADRALEQADDKQFTRTPPYEQQAHALPKVHIYLNGFISICQGGPKERRQMLRQLFRSIDTVFRTNKATDGLHKEPI